MTVQRLVVWSVGLPSGYPLAWFLYEDDAQQYQERKLPDGGQVTSTVIVVMEGD